MKTLLRIATIIALMVAGTATTYAQNEYRRTIKKSCPVTVESISIDHQHGSVVINEWDKAEIYMSVEIVAKGKTNEIAKEISNCIDVKFLPNLNNGTKIKTEINHSQIQKLSKQSTEYQINITINAPRSLATMLICKYGTATLNAPIKNLTADTKYGNLSVAQIDGNAKIVAKYGNVIVDQAINLDLDIKYGKATIDNVDKLNAMVGYGSIDIERVIDAQFSEIGYSHCTIGQFANSLDVESLQYSSITATANDSFTSAVVDAAYSPVNLTFSGNVTFNSDLTNSYGAFHYKGINCSTYAGSKNHQVSVCGKEFEKYNGKQTGKTVNVKNRYADIAIVKK